MEMFQEAIDHIIGRVEGMLEQRKSPGDFWGYFRLLAMYPSAHASWGAGGILFVCPPSMEWPDGIVRTCQLHFRNYGIVSPYDKLFWEDVAEGRRASGVNSAPDEPRTWEILGELASHGKIEEVGALLRKMARRQRQFCKEEPGRLEKLEEWHNRAVAAQAT